MMYCFLVAVMAVSPSGGSDMDARIEAFKSRLDRPDWVCRHLLTKHSLLSKAIDLSEDQRKELAVIRSKYERRYLEAKSQVDRKFPAAWGPQNAETRKINQRRHREMQLAGSDIAKAWRSEIRKVLTPQQIHRYNEIAVQRWGFRALLDPRIAQVLAMTDEQKAQIEVLHRRAISIADEEFDNPGYTEAEAAVFRQRQFEKALQVLDEAQRAGLEKLMGRPAEDVYP